MARLNPAISKIIAIVLLIVFLAIVIWTAFFLEPAESDIEGAAYDGAEGTITVTLKEPLGDGRWVASVYITDSDSNVRYYTTSGIVTPSSDRMSFVITDANGNLTNLPNGTFSVDIYSQSVPPHDTMTFSVEVTDHVYSTTEIIIIALAVGFLIFAVALVIIRRIVRGR